MATRKKPTNMTLAPDVLAAIDRMAAVLGSNRTEVTSRCVRYAARLVEREGKKILQSPEAEEPILSPPSIL